MAKLSAYGRTMVQEWTTTRGIKLRLMSDGKYLIKVFDKWQVCSVDLAEAIKAKAKL